MSERMHLLRQSALIDVGAGCYSHEEAACSTCRHLGRETENYNYDVNDEMVIVKGWVCDAVPFGDVTAPAAVYDAEEYLALLVIQKPDEFGCTLWEAKPLSTEA